MSWGEDAWKDRRDVLWMQAESDDPEVAIGARLELRPIESRPTATLAREIDRLEAIVAAQERGLRALRAAAAGPPRWAVVVPSELARWRERRAATVARQETELAAARRRLAAAQALNGEGTNEDTTTA